MHPSVTLSVKAPLVFQIDPFSVHVDEMMQSADTMFVKDSLDGKKMQGKS